MVLQYYTNYIGNKFSFRYKFQIFLVVIQSSSHVASMENIISK